MRKSHKPSHLSTMDQVHRAVCIVTLFVVAALFFYVISVTKNVAEGIARRDGDFAQVKEQVLKNNEELATLTREQQLNTAAITSLNTDLIELHGRLDVLSLRIQRPTTKPSE